MAGHEHEERPPGDRPAGQTSTRTRSSRKPPGGCETRQVNTAAIACLALTKTSPPHRGAPGPGDLLPSGLYRRLRPVTGSAHHGGLPSKGTAVGRRGSRARGRSPIPPVGNWPPGARRHGLTLP